MELSLAYRERRFSGFAPGQEGGGRGSYWGVLLNERLGAGGNWRRRKQRFVPGLMSEGRAAAGPGEKIRESMMHLSLMLEDKAGGLRI